MAFNAGSPVLTSAEAPTTILENVIPHHDHAHMAAVRLISKLFCIVWQNIIHKHLNLFGLAFVVLKLLLPGCIGLGKQLNHVEARRLFLGLAALGLLVTTGVTTNATLSARR